MRAAPKFVMEFVIVKYALSFNFDDATSEKHSINTAAKLNATISVVLIITSPLK